MELVPKMLNKVKQTTAALYLEHCLSKFRYFWNGIKKDTHTHMSLV